MSESISPHVPPELISFRKVFAPTGDEWKATACNGVSVFGKTRNEARTRLLAVLAGEPDTSPAPLVWRAERPTEEGAYCVLPAGAPEPFWAWFIPTEDEDDVDTMLTFGSELTRDLDVCPIAEKVHGQRYLYEVRSLQNAKFYGPITIPAPREEGE